MEEKIYIIWDKKVKSFAGALVKGAPLYDFTADEKHKTIETVLDICRWLLEQGADRKSLVYAVGGGVTTDLVGFAASIYKRGVRYINVPTTLLSQVDAGIGGKTGCNLDGYKNILGVTRFPEKSIFYPESLKTLPERELRSGAAEMLKTFIIKDDGNYEKAVELLSADKIDFDALAPLIEAAADVKREIVEQDPYEYGLRRVLNLGHTYAHAIEWWQDDKLFSHGEAVAIGIIEAAKLSEKMNLCPEGLSDKLRSDFIRCKLPVELPCPKEELQEAIWKDKKVENGRIHFVLIKAIGNVIIEDIDDLQ